MGFGRDLKRNLKREQDDVRTCSAQKPTASVDTLDVAHPPIVPRVTIAMLPDVALLEIFDFFTHGFGYYYIPSNRTALDRYLAVGQGLYTQSNKLA